MTAVKPWYLSKRVWGAIFVLASTFGLARYGISYDPDANTITIALDTLTEKALAGTGLFGMVLNGIGQFVAKHRLTW